MISTKAIPIPKRLAAGWVVGALLLALLGCQRNPTQTAVEYTPDMVDAVPYEAFSANPILKDRRTIQPPPTHTVPRGYSPFDFGPEPEEALRAGQELINAVPRTQESTARGMKLFQRYCAVCHGQKGEGDGPVVPRFPMPPSLLADHSVKLADGHIFHIITRGQKLMPPYAIQIPVADRWHLVNYVRSLQQGGPKP